MSDKRFGYEIDGLGGVILMTGPAFEHKESAEKSLDRLINGLKVPASATIIAYVGVVPVALDSRTLVPAQ